MRRARRRRHRPPSDLQRGRGLSSRLLRAVLERWGDAEVRRGAQAYLHDWYAGFGFERCGENFWEAGIEHVPMRRLPRA